MTQVEKSRFGLLEFLITLCIIGMITAIAIPGLVRAANTPRYLQNVVVKQVGYSSGKFEFVISYKKELIRTEVDVYSVALNSRNDDTTFTMLSGRLNRNQEWARVTIWVGNEDDFRIWREYLQKIWRENNPDYNPEYDEPCRVLPPETP